MHEQHKHLPVRSAWDAFPDVVICASQSAVKQHPDYDQAKHGNVVDAASAAKRLSIAMVDSKVLETISGLPIEGAFLVPVHALEGQGFNRIPTAFAALPAQELGLGVETSIIQINVVNHTGASGWQRLASPPLFEGQVEDGRHYLLVDDFIGQGSTLANLRGHINHHAGHVVGAVCLTGRADSSKLALTSQTLEALRKKHGPEIENWWVEAFGYDFSCLTESEARYLFRVEDAHAIRARLAEARSQADA